MKKLLTTLIILCFSYIAHAQCGAGNSSFKEGEQLTYDLYFNWSFVWVKVGTASWNITKSNYAGEPAYKTTLITSTNKRADKFFVMRDTLTSYTDMDVSPLYYTKRAFEGDTHRIDEVSYSYPNNKCQLKMSFRKNFKKPEQQTKILNYCAFDMISMMLRARSYDPSSWKPGYRQKFWMADGNDCEEKSIVFRGRENFKVERSNTKYRCLVFSFMEREGKKEKEIVRFYITDDKNHLPVRLDLFLKFGSAKAFLTNAKGVRHEQTSIMK